MLVNRYNAQAARARTVRLSVHFFGGLYTNLVAGVRVLAAYTPHANGSVRTRGDVVEAIDMLKVLEQQSAAWHSWCACDALPPMRIPCRNSPVAANGALC